MPESGRGLSGDAALPASQSFRFTFPLLRPRPRSRVPRRIASALLATLLGTWVGGLVLFVGARGTVTVALARRQTAPVDEHNLASWRWGVEVRASSYLAEVANQHHPLFLIDGRSDPSLQEKWTSSKTDRAPWVELRWTQPRSLSSVVVVHAGQHEDAALTVRDYTIICLRDTGAEVALSITDNHVNTTRHDFVCPGARGIRLQIDHHQPGALARIYEIEAIGR